MHRCRRFSLRTLVVVVTLLTIWIGLKANRANRQKLAVETLTTLGGQVWYDYQVRGRDDATLGIERIDPEANVPVPGWVQRAAGEHYFIRPVDVHIRDRRLIDEKKLHLLADLQGLEELSLGRMRLEGADLAGLPPLADLRRFSIESSFLPSENGLEDFSFLAGFPRLRWLRLPFKSFDDDDARHLQGMNKIRSLNLQGGRLGDAGLKRLRHMTQLESLDLGHTRVTDEGLASLRYFTKLRSLNLNGTALTDAGLAHLRPLRRLAYLSLIDTAITDAGLHHLTDLPRLRRVELIGPEISDQAASELATALPKCRIRLDWDRWIGLADPSTRLLPGKPGAP